MDNMENNKEVTEMTEEAVEAVEVEDGNSDDSAEEIENSKKATRKAGWLIRDIFEWGETLVSAVIIIVVIFTFVMRVTSVDGGSMTPTLKDGDQMLVANLFYTPKHNDIVVLYAPHLLDGGEYGKDIIKRVVGLEGDRIRIDSHSGTVYRNDEALEITEDEAAGLLFEDGHAINTRTFDAGGLVGEVTVPEGHIFVLGDNRGSSTDSRTTAMRATAMGHHGYVGMVDVNHVAGRAFFRVAPFNSFGFVK
jgi:signal peptidase I